MNKDAINTRPEIQVKTTLPKIGYKMNVLVASLQHGYNVNGITVMAN